MKSRPRKIFFPKRVEFLLDNPIYELLKKRAVQQDTSVSEILRELVIDSVVSDDTIMEVKRRWRRWSG